MSHSILDPDDISALNYIITHVFFPPQLPKRADRSVFNDHALAHAVANAAFIYGDYVGQASLGQWASISRMLEDLQAVTQTESLNISQILTQFRNMDVGDVLALPVRGQNAGVVFRKQKEATIYESFEVFLKAQSVTTTEGKLICSYPGPAIEIPNLVFNNLDFRSELANFLNHMNHDDLTAGVTRHQAESSDFKDTTHPRYITELLTGILRSVGRPANVSRITKRVGDDIVGNDSGMLPWRRSPMWLFIRVALQTTLDQSPLGHHAYKEFMLFFMCCLAREKICAELPSEFLWFMSAKLSRRLRKLDPSTPGWLSHIVLQTCTSLQSTIENRWQLAQAAQRISPNWAPSELDFTHDIRLSLSSSSDYLRDSLASAHTIPQVSRPFTPNHHSRGTLNDFLSFNGEFFEQSYRTDPCVTLYDVEQAVEKGIDAWIDQATNSEEACVKLEMLAKNYSSSALKTYANNPELLSVMLLTIIELWVALDKIVIKVIPMLADYSPEVPISCLETPLLCKNASLRRLGRAREYLLDRHSRSRTGWSVFSSTITQDSFSTRFYRKSSNLWRLKRGIRKLSLDELREMVSDLHMRPRRSRYHVGMWDRVRKRPSPSDRLVTQVVSFELYGPIPFALWRTATFQLLLHLCPPSSIRDTLQTQLDDYHRIFRQRLLHHQRPRLSLGFFAGPLCFLHPKLPIPTKQEVDCVRTGLKLFSLNTLVQTLCSALCPGYCSYKLQSGPYANLQKYVNSTTHTSNEAIANQTECHEDLSIHEYVAFGHLRSGGLLQWLNVLRELRGRSLSFSRPEVHMLLAQAVSQAGPFENQEWTWHLEIRQLPFCNALLRELEKISKDVEANWMEGVTMDTISFILRRLLASRPYDTVSLEARNLLRAVRSKVFSWVHDLSAELVKTPGNEELRGLLRDTAAICRSTFDLDAAMIPWIFNSAEDVDVLVSCAIIIHDHIPSDLFSLPAYSQLLLDRDRHLSLSLESVITDLTRSESDTNIGSDGISLAVRRIWPGYHAGSRWIPLSVPNSRWLSCVTAPPADQRSQVVHFNIIDGSLLIDGKPFGTWLPNDILAHPLYQLLFGKARLAMSVVAQYAYHYVYAQEILAAVPSDLPGMNYSTKDLISDHQVGSLRQNVSTELRSHAQVYFSLSNTGSELMIRAKRKRTVVGDSGTIELIPHERLKDDFPATLIEGHVHWLDLSTSIIEIRPLDSLWETSSENWMLDCTPGHYRMWKGHEYLVDIRSRSWDMVSSLLRPLSTSQELIVSISPIDPSQHMSLLRLSVFLPRYGLSFYVDEDGDLQSGNIRGMVYDENQSVETLFGLVNQLVLRPKVKDLNTSGLVPRCVLIPDGDISYQMDDHHVRVQITTHHTNCERIMYQLYKVNTELDCLTGNGTLTSKLYLAYLHALTSGCGEDPLTGRSGVEEALSVLRSAGHCSTMRFDPRDAELLGLIASTCPSQTWYSSQYMLKVVEWRSLRQGSQQDELSALAKAIKKRFEMIREIYGSPPVLSLQDFALGGQVDHVPKQIAHRAACNSPFGLPEKTAGLNLDVRYPARDVIAANSGEDRAYIAAICVYQRTAARSRDLWQVVESWKKRVSSDTIVSLRYGRWWLAPDLPLIWLKTYNLLRKSDENKWFQMLFSLPAMVYAFPKLEWLVPVFVAFASRPQFLSEDPPHYWFYEISDGCRPSVNSLAKYVVDSAYPFERSPEHLDTKSGKRDNTFREHREQWQNYSNRRRSDAETTAQAFLNAWPCESPPRCSLRPDLYDIAVLEAKVQRLFSSCLCNIKLKEHLTRVQMILNELPSYHSLDPETVRYVFGPSKGTPSHVPWCLDIDQLFARPAPSLEVDDKFLRSFKTVETTSRPNSAPLSQLIAIVGTNATNPFQVEYVSALHTSAKSLGSDPSLVGHAMQLPSSETLRTHYMECRARYIEALHRLQSHLGPRSTSEEAVRQAGQWPHFTARALFHCIASNSPISLPDHWKKCIIKFTVLVLQLQRARRMVLLHLDNLHEELFKELRNEGCDGWDAEAHPDWLLIQLEGNFLIRRVQAEVANEMISPYSGANTAMQLNMGEGKSSVIVPIAVAVLANGQQLVRIIVPKPLTTQTLRTLADCLGGLTSRRIYYLPFSRSLEVDERKIESLREVMQECMRDRGVLVVQPEHLLSLKLASVEKKPHQPENGQVSHMLLGLQRWLHSYSRDILDESDEILDVRSQLVFTIGHQQHVDGAPERWTTTQQVLCLVSKHASSLQKKFPLGVEYGPGLSPGSFPHFRILQKEAGETLSAWIVGDVMQGHVPNFSFAYLHFHSGLEDAIHTFISREDVPPAHAHLVKKHFKETSLWSGLLLLRGLLATGILLYAFKERRWRVDYGLAPARTMLAVPYRAKDVPAPRAEFCHPDIAIILTCLSYYYGGLTEDQLRHSFGILFEKHVPSLDYELWVQGCPHVPESLQTISGVNIDSKEQWTQYLVPLFSWNQATIDFYLSNVVFMREAKECPSKLPSSSWDLAEMKARPVTGFSGTNDGQHLFPSHITQRDPDHQSGTNAKVLSYLLQPENKHYMCMTHPCGRRQTTLEFLQILVSQSPEIRVLLDVGAQMLDLQNHALAKAWLDMSPDASAAVYFNEDDELTVCTHDGRTQLLQSSPFAQQIDRCVVYLDDAHTRGTDIKFPIGFRGAVTLGPKVTKDRLVQGCMRMRKLGHGHSVMFFAPHEVDRRIRVLIGKDEPSGVIDTTDILRWAIQETWENIHRWAPHWVQQGVEHASRYDAWSKFCGKKLTSKELSKKWIQQETKKLEHLYEPHNPSDTALEDNPDIRQRCIDLGVLSLSSVGLDEEQERELAYEVRRERQVSRRRQPISPDVLPGDHSIHADVVHFVKTGVIPAGTQCFGTRSAVFIPAWDTLRSTSAETDEAYIWSQSVLVTADFAKTIQEPGKLDDYLRPVQWIVSAKRGSGDVLVILSPYEVNCLLPVIRSSNQVHLHLYTPRITKLMKTCEDLALHSIPTVPDGWIPPSPLMDQLNVFAGQLYLRDHESYIRLCRFLGVYARDLEGEEKIVTELDGFILPENRNQFKRSRMEIAHTFAKTPLVSLKALMTLRAKGTDFMSTHMGKIIDGRVLSEQDFWMGNHTCFIQKNFHQSLPLGKVPTDRNNG